MEPLREIRNRLLNGWQLSKMHTFEVAARHQSFALAAEELSLSPSAVVDASRLSVEEIRSIAERHKQENPNLSLIMADYLGLIEKPKADRNDLAIAHISGSLKAIAKDLKTPVISLSQLSRDVEKRPNKRPTNADLRDSGSIEQDADSIIMLYREAVYDENSSAAPFAEIIVTKNRFGSLGTVYQRFCNGHFVACDQDEARQICTASNAPAARGRRYAQGADV
ncbi:DnaB-like helicase C-terminal domain-containing protein [Escherichia coli]|uniref:DnaB-like helicase C-terminal domain-containing protein n=1 Tax=Escherichia coli TaxID=562 RepID=UPI0002C8D3DB|nr:DnaB-like helicase C-terminal domain-containing protein [Escherichia coli]EMZ81043.1 bacterial regulatory helix-turn-helix, lysR family protein [Escherichia coli 2722950]ENB21604.1 bacterial regulatory helix-turn-helix, lysR family protein [Escherichia coli BCE011_MS-01]HBA6239057.1 LysR family transcriptional regulator [Escherichia coli]HBA6520110.1 LysR family transcriptional regulator [Escherichia coli]HBA6625907.1 LysR family transcriptional regulator [Escherichia coli]